MDNKAKVSLTVECTPDAANIPQVVALVELLLNGRGDTRELSSALLAALLAALLETSCLIETGTLSPAEHPRVWELVETACEVVAEQVRGALVGSDQAAAVPVKLNGAHKNGHNGYGEMQFTEEMGQ